MKPNMRALIILFTISILSACGQKGPLFLPGEELPGEELPAEEPKPSSPST